MTHATYVAENTFSQGVGVFCALPTDDARRLLPSHLTPIELRHGSAILSAVVFDFTDGPAGPYRELVMSIHVAPLIEAGRALPKAALYPFHLGSTTLSACEYAIDVWHFPHWRQRLDIGLRPREGRIQARVAAGGEPILELAATGDSWAPQAQTYQSFMHDGASYMTYVTHAGDLSEHEEERGFLRLFEHPFHGELALPQVEEVPFRETWMRSGTQSFEQAQTLSP